MPDLCTLATIRNTTNANAISSNLQTREEGKGNDACILCHSIARHECLSSQTEQQQSYESVHSSLAHQLQYPFHQESFQLSKAQRHQELHDSNL